MGLLPRYRRESSLIAGWETFRKSKFSPHTNNYVRDLKEMLAESIQRALEALEQVQDKNAAYYDRKAKPREQKPGDHVLVLLPVSHQKMLLRWHGTCLVLKKTAPCDYSVDRPGGEKGLPHQHAQTVPKESDGIRLLKGSAWPLRGDGQVQQILVGMGVLSTDRPSSPAASTS